MWQLKADEYPATGCLAGVFQNHGWDSASEFYGGNCTRCISCRWSLVVSTTNCVAIGVIHSPQPTRPIAPHFGSERTAISICGYSLCSRNTDGIWAGELWRRGYRVRVTTAPIAAPIANHFVLRFSWRQKLPPIAAVTAASRSRVSAAERACSSFKFAFAAASCA